MDDLKSELGASICLKTSRNGERDALQEQVVEN